MALMPKRTKFRKQQRGRIKGPATRGNKVEFGDFGLQAIQPGYISSQQIEAGRVAATRASGGGKIWIRIFPHKPVTSTPAETRMGKGKGEPSFWAATVRSGTVLYEIGGVTEDVARLAFNRTAHKMPVRCRLVRRRHKV